MRQYDLENRTTLFAEAVITFVNGVKRSPILTPLIVQLVRSATSIGANYLEADDAVSKKDFCYRISICKKEARESKYWLRMLVKADPSLRPLVADLYREANELHLIFSKIFRTAKANGKQT